MRRKLYREVNGRVRYYLVELHPTLFGEYIVERIYGAVRNKKPSGRKVEYFNAQSEGIERFFKVLEKKERKGYVGGVVCGFY